MSYWNAFTKKYPSRSLVRIDGGSIFMRGLAAAPVANRYMLEGTSRSNLDAVNMTAWDLPVWQEMGDLAAAGLIPREYLKIPLVSANVTTALPDFPAFQRFVVKELQIDPKAGKPLRLGITGILSDPEERISRKDFQVQKPELAARQVLADMSGKVDYVIMLTDLGLGEAISLVVVVPGIHMIVVAHNYTVPLDAQTVGDTMIVGPANEGKMISEIRLNIKSGAQQMEVESRAVPLEKTVPDDPVFGEFVRKGQAEVEKAAK